MSSDHNECGAQSLMSLADGWMFTGGCELGRAPPSASGSAGSGAPLHVPCVAPSSIAHVLPGQSVSLAHAARGAGLRQSVRF